MHKSSLLPWLLVFVLAACTTSPVAPSTATLPPTQPPTKPTESTPAGPPQVRVIQEKAAFYSGPGNLAYPTLAVLAIETPLEAIGLYGDFLKARTLLDGKALEGFIYSGWVDQVPENLPFLTQADFASTTADALAWDGWDFDYQNMKASVKNGSLAASSLDGYMTIFNEAHPLVLKQPLSFKVQAQGQGSAAEIEFSGRLQTNEVDWWKDIRRLEVRFWSENKQDGRFISYLDGTQDSAVETIKLMALPEDGIFYIHFWDTAGQIFSLTDSRGKTLTIGCQQCLLPSPLFPDEVAYIGYNLHPASSIKIYQFEVLGDEQVGIFANTARLAQDAALYLAQENHLTGQVESLPAGTPVQLLGAAGETAWVEWNRIEEPPVRGVMELDLLNDLQVDPRPVGMEMPWLFGENGLFWEGWAGTDLATSPDGLILDSRGGISRAGSAQTILCQDSLGVSLEMQAEGSAAGVEVASSSVKATLWVRDGNRLTLQSGDQVLDFGLLPEDGKVELRLAQETARLFVGNQALPGVLSLSGWTCAGGVQISLLTEKVTRLEITQLNILMAPQTDFAGFVQQVASAAEAAKPVIRADNAAALSLIERWGKGSVMGTFWSPDGSTLALPILNQKSPDYMGDIYFYDTDSFQQFSMLEKSTDMDFLGFLPDGQSVAVAKGEDFQLVDVRTGEVLLNLPGQIRIPYHYGSNLSLSPDGSLAAWIGTDETVKVYRTRDWSVQYSLPHQDLPEKFWQVLSISPDNTRLAVLRVSPDYKKFLVQIWDLETGTILRSLPQGTTFISISPDWKYYLYTSISGGSIYVVHVLRMDDFSQVSTFNASYPEMEFSPDSSLLAISGAVYATSDWSVLGHYSANGLTPSADGQKLAGVSEDGVPVIYDTASGAIITRLKDFIYTSGYDEVALSLDGRWMASGGRLLVVRNMRNGSIHKEYSYAEGIMYASSIGFSADGSRMAVKTGYYTSKVFDLETGQDLGSFGECMDSECYPALTPDGSLVAVTEGFWVRIYQVADGSQVAEFMLTGGNIKPVGLAYAPEARLLAVLGKDGSLWLYNPQSQTQQLLAPASNSSNQEEAKVVFSPAGGLLAAIGTGGMQVWDIDTGERLFMLPGSDAYYSFRNVEFSPDGSLLLVSFSRNYAQASGLSAYTALYRVGGWDLVHILQELPNTDWGSIGTFSADGRAIIIPGRGTVDFYGIPAQSRPPAPPKLGDTALLFPAWDGARCVDVPGATGDDIALILYDCYSYANQQWRAEAVGDGWVRLVSGLTGKCMQVTGSTLGEGAAVWQATCDEGDNQLWLPVSVSDAYYQLQTRNGEFCLAAQAVMNQYPQLVVSACKPVYQQIWEFREP